jgi:hypothetical protein
MLHEVALLQFWVRFIVKFDEHKFMFISSPKPGVLFSITYTDFTPKIGVSNLLVHGSYPFSPSG